MNNVLCAEGPIFSIILMYFPFSQQRQQQYLLFYFYLVLVKDAGCSQPHIFLIFQIFCDVGLPHSAIASCWKTFLLNMNAYKWPSYQHIQNGLTVDSHRR